jgi:hypothetical protein
VAVPGAAFVLFVGEDDGRRKDGSRGSSNGLDSSNNGSVVKPATGATGRGVVVHIGWGYLDNSLVGLILSTSC